MTTQREFLMGLTATLTLVFAVPAGDAFAQRGGKSQGSYDDPQCDVTVTGTNSAPVDSDAINTAVNGAGLPSDATVCLEGTFEFGESQFVSIIADPLVERLRITGIDGATILFGIQPLRLLPGSDLEQLTIDHIRFVRPSITAVSIFDGLELVQISDNVVDGVQTAEVPALGVSLREGIVVSSASVDIGGKVVITDNWVDAGVYTVSDFDFNHVNAGIGAFGPVVGGGGLDAEVVISGNTVLNWAGSGIQVIANEGETLIERNVVEPGIVANNLPVACVANGIDVTATSDTVVRRNTIDVVPAMTKFVTAPNCTAAILLRSFAGGGVLDGSSDNLVRNNHIRGAGLYGIVVQGDPATPSENNTFVGNQLGGFTAEAANVWLNEGANLNTFKGALGTVIDLGADNTFKGLAIP